MRTSRQNIITYFVLFFNTDRPKIDKIKKLAFFFIMCYNNLCIIGMKGG